MRTLAKTNGSADPLLKRIDKLTEAFQEVAEALQDAKAPQITVESAKVEIPKQDAAEIKVEAPARPKSAEIISETLKDGRRKHEITFHY